MTKVRPVRLVPYASALLASLCHGRCALCQQAMAMGVRERLRHKQLVCAHCHKLISWHSAPLVIDMQGDGVTLPLFAPVHYQYPINEAMHAFKQSEDLSALMVLLHAIYRLPKPKGAHKTNTVIACVPTTKSRLSERGFDPVLTLARHLSHHWDLPLWQGIRRIDDAAHQRGLDKAGRLDNIQNAFALQTPLPVKQVVLFDDVVTTGATLWALMQTLHTYHQDVRVMGVCVAHGSAGFSTLKKRAAYA